MIILTDTMVGVQCSKCGELHFRTLSRFAFSHFNKEYFSCSCGAPLLTILKIEDSKFRIEYPCIYCGKTHQIVAKRSAVWGEDVLKLECQVKKLPIGYIGKRNSITGLCQEMKQGFVQFASQLVNDEEPDNDFEYFFIIYALMEKIGKMAEADLLGCKCGNNNLAVEILPEGIEIICEKCHAVGMISAADKEILSKIDHMAAISLEENMTTLINNPLQREKSWIKNNKFGGMIIMSFVPVKDLLQKAQQGKYAVGAFNCNNMEIVQAIVTAAEAEKSPVIIQASQGAIKYAGIHYIAGLTKIAAKSVSVPVALHLDHGTSFDQCMLCIRHGFSSVMIDGSKHPLAENIALVKKVLEVARPLGVSVEGELGKIGGTEDDISVSEKDAFFTDPVEAKTFCDETGVDALAVAIGTAHGQYKGIPKLDFDRLREIVKLVSTPIVLHGSSGVPDDAVRQAISLGVCKVNIDTNIREAFVYAAGKAIQDNPKEIDPRKILTPAREAAIETIREK